MAKGLLDIKKGDLYISYLHIIHTERNNQKGVLRSFDNWRCAQELSQGFAEFWPEADVILSEIPTGSKSEAAAKGLSIATGVLSGAQKPVIPITPQEVKMATAGANAEKDAMIEWAYDLHPEAPWYTATNGRLLKKNEHCADAIAAIYAGLSTPFFQELYPAFDAKAFREKHLKVKQPNFGLS